MHAGPVRDTGEDQVADARGEQARQEDSLEHPRRELAARRHGLEQQQRGGQRPAEHGADRGKAAREGHDRAHYLVLASEACGVDPQRQPDRRQRPLGPEDDPEHQCEERG